MKKLFRVGMLLCALCMFIACSDDDKLPISEEVTILPKKVMKIVVIEDGNDHSMETYTYKYDNDKVAEIVYSSGSNDTYTCQYKDGKVAITGTTTGFIEIKDGKAVKMKTDNGVLTEENLFQYTPAGYLDYITTKWTDDDDSYTETETFTLVNGCFTTYREKEDEEEITSIDYDYGDYAYLNNLSIDLWSMLTNCLHGSDVGGAFAFGSVGNRAKYLPVGLHEKDMDEDDPDDFYQDFHYTMNGEYITNIKLTEKGEKDSVGWEIQIYYED